MVEILADPTVITWLAGIAAFVSIIAFAIPFVIQDQKANRLKEVTNRRKELSAKQVEDLNPRAALRVSRQSRQVDMMKKVLEQLKLQDLIGSKKIRAELNKAGYRGHSAVIVFLFSRLIAAGIVGGGTAMIVFVMSNLDHPTAVKMIFVAIGFAAGYYLPKLLIANQAQKRATSMAKSFPDAMDLLVICVESGLSVENSFARVTEEIADQSPILAQEIGLTSAELSYLGDRAKAYQNFSLRTGMDQVKSLTTTLIQSERYGTPVAVALRVLSQEQRDDRMSRAEKKAAALPAKLTVPMIVFFLPLLFMVIIGPMVIKALSTF
ncbi:MAG: type II secretion system F family protein [Magnetospiraceae bacterium]